VLPARDRKIFEEIARHEKKEDLTAAPVTKSEKAHVHKSSALMKVKQHTVEASKHVKVPTVAPWQQYVADHPWQAYEMNAQLADERHARKAAVEGTDTAAFVDPAFEQIDVPTTPEVQASPEVKKAKESTPVATEAVHVSSSTESPSLAASLAKPKEVETLLGEMRLSSVPWQVPSSEQPVMAAAPTDNTVQVVKPERLIRWATPVRNFMMWVAGENQATPVAGSANKASLLQGAPKSKKANPTLLNKQDPARTAEAARMDKLHDIVPENQWERLQDADALQEEELHHEDNSARVAAETPEKPHFLTAKEVKSRTSVHMSDQWINLEEQDKGIEKAIHDIGDGGDLNSYGKLGSIQDDAMQTMNRQLAAADASSQHPRPVMMHSDPGAQMLHEPFQNLQENDEHVEGQIDNNPDLKHE